uniref:BED-type domain-containing protein n=1 Tax=Ananas comosus var. bracteatus TaxID=296719 RepID=A0A6V7Q269_ANACO|nr:unnamed protein product [Ananas comosus var. bracteatus]
MVRGRDACWEHCVLVDATRQKVRCNYCNREFSGGVYRMKFHLAQIKNKDIVPCPKFQRIGQHGSTCPSLLLPRPSPSAQPSVDDAQKQKHNDADKKIALFFFHNSISFAASKSSHYQAMVDAIAECGPGYKAPSFEVLRSTLLEKVKGEVNDNYRKLREDWKGTGCTILTDSWSDGRSKSLLVFSVASPRGTHFLKLVDVSSHADDACYLYELLDSIILEVGAENVVQIITDCRMSNACVGTLLLKKYPSLFWSPCASYMVEKILEDISKLEWANLPKTRGQEIKSLLFSERFWKSAHEAVRVSEPLLKILRVVDGDMPAMGYIYEGIERAKVAIKLLYKGCEEKCIPILDIIDGRWSSPFHHLHAAAAFLNPSIFYSPDFKFDANMRNSFHAAMWKMFPEEKDKIELTKEQPLYLNAQGALRSEFAILGRRLNAPGDWWAAYGYEIPILQRAAMRILSQPCSSYWFKWNWETFDNVITKKHSRMELEKLTDLLYVHCNLRLQAIGQNRAGKCKPVVYDEIDVSCEWPSELESSSLILDDSWLDNFPIECRGSPSSYE